MKIKTRVAAVAGALALVGGMTTFNATVASADGAGHNAKITDSKNSSAGKGRLLVCKDWGTTSCAKNSVKIVLVPGQTSPWPDADGFYVGAGSYAMINGAGKAPYTEGWHKLVGAPLTQHYTVTTYPLHNWNTAAFTLTPPQPPSSLPNYTRPSRATRGHWWEGLPKPKPQPVKHPR